MACIQLGDNHNTFFFLNRISSLTNLQHKPKGTFQIHLAFYHNENLLVPFLLVPGVSQ